MQLIIAEALTCIPFDWRHKYSTSFTLFWDHALCSKLHHSRTFLTCHIAHMVPYLALGMNVILAL